MYRIRNAPTKVVHFANDVRYVLAPSAYLGITIFPSGDSTVLDIAKADNDYYKGIAKWVGYYGPGAWRTYAFHHDLVHNFLAQYQGLPHSAALWCASQLEPTPEESQMVDRDEKLTNAIHRMTKFGQVTDDYEVDLLQATWDITQIRLIMDMVQGLFKEVGTLYVNP